MVSAGRSQARGSSDRRRGPEGLAEPTTMASHRQRHQPDRRTVRETVTGAQPVQSHRLVRVRGVRARLLQGDHVAMGLLRWDSQEKREAIKSASRDTSLTSQCPGGQTKVLANEWALDGPSAIGGAAKQQHSWVLSLLLRRSLSKAFTALEVTKR